MIGGGQRQQQDTTITGEYIRILLLSLASPYHLRRGEVGKLYVNLERWMYLPTLNKNQQGDSIVGDFCVNLTKDKPPSYLAISDDDPHDAHVRMLDTLALAETLFGELQQSEEIKSKTLMNINMTKAQLSHNLIRRLGKSWGVKPKRAHDRMACREKTQVVFGLSAAHQTIMKNHQDQMDFVRAAATHDSQLMRMITTESRYEGKQVRHAADVNPDVWEMIYDNGKLKLVNASGSSPTENKPDTPPSQFCSNDSWQLINLSDGGFCIQCDTNCGTNIQVGEIAGFLPNNNNPQKRWSIGVIRWMRSDGKNGIRLGGQLLGQDAIPVGISMAAEGIENNTVQRALLLPATKSLGRPSTLITLATPFRAGAIVKLHMETGLVNVRLNNDREGAGLYDEFEYEQVKYQDPVIQPHEEKTRDSSDDFNDVWSSI